MTLPEDERAFPTPKHQNANRELYVPQEKLQEIEYLKDSEWFPENTQYNIYNQKDWKMPPAGSN